MKTPSCSSRFACDCDTRFLLPVGLLPSNEHPGVVACLHCGALAWNTRDNTGNMAVSSDSPPRETLTSETLAWLDRWPRLLTTPDGDFACLPTALRCSTLRQLEIIRNAAWNAQRHLPSGRRLRRAGYPKTPPPSSLPSSLNHYRLLWEAAGFTPETDLHTLLHWANPAHALVSPFALDALLQRRGLRLLLTGLANSPVLHRRLVLCRLAQEDTSLIPLLQPHLKKWLRDLEATPDSPRARLFADEAETCRITLRAWSLAAEFAQNPADGHSEFALEANADATA